MSQPTMVLLVKFKSPLSLDKAREALERRIGEFRALDGLAQKYYLQDTATGEYAGLYLWKTPEALAEFRNSELRKTIAKAYQAVGEPRVEVFEIFEALRDD